MKTHTDLFGNTVSPEGLLLAWDEFKAGKRQRRDVQEFEYRLEDNLFTLHEELTNKTYRHSPYHAFHIRDPKVRLIHKAEVRDRVVHHAVFKALNPIFEPTFIADSYSCRKDKGSHRAVRRLRFFLNKTWQNNKRCFVLKCDIRKFFQSMDHEILYGLIAPKIRDEDMRWLIRRLIHSFSAAAHERERERERDGAHGAPIGNLTSQLFANVYLDPLDQFVKHSLKERYYIRYTDDFVIVHPDPEHLRKVKEKIERFLAATLRLELHPDKVEIRKYSQGIDFLGYVLLPHATVMRSKTRRRMLRKLRLKVQKLKGDEISEASFTQSLASYYGVLGHAKTHRLKEDIQQEIWASLRDP